MRGKSRSAPVLSLSRWREDTLTPPPLGGKMGFSFDRSTRSSFQALASPKISGPARKLGPWECLLSPAKIV